MAGSHRQSPTIRVCGSSLTQTSAVQTFGQLPEDCRKPWTKEAIIQKTLHIYLSLIEREMVLSGFCVKLTRNTFSSTNAAEGCT